MRLFYCKKCGEQEQVGDDCDRMTHFHNGNLFALEEMPVSLDSYYPNKKRVANMVESLEFVPGNTYMVLYDPFSVDQDTLERLIAKYMDQNVRIIFVPCNFSVSASGFVSETVTLDSLEVMEQWLKEQKDKMMVKNYKEGSETFCPIHRVWDFCSYRGSV